MKKKYTKYYTSKIIQLYTFTKLTITYIFKNAINQKLTTIKFYYLYYYIIIIININRK